MTDSQAYDELYAYSMGRPGFILQHVVDAQAAQTATSHTKSMGLTFALVGLFLRVEHRFSGQQVQKAHMRLAQRKRDWPPICLPVNRGQMTPTTVFDVPAGPERDRAIDAWCASVWDAFSENRDCVIQVLRADGII